MFGENIESRRPRPEKGSEEVPSHLEILVDPKFDEKFLENQGRLEYLLERAKVGMISNGLVALHVDHLHENDVLAPEEASEALSRLLTGLLKSPEGTLKSEYHSVDGILNAQAAPTNTHEMFQGSEKVKAGSSMAHALWFTAECLKEHRALLENQLGPLHKVELPDAISCLSPLTMSANSLAQLQLEAGSAKRPLAPKEMIDAIAAGQEASEPGDVALSRLLLQLNPKLKGNETAFLRFCKKFADVRLSAEAELKAGYWLQNTARSEILTKDDDLLADLPLFVETLNQLRSYLWKEKGDLLAQFGHGIEVPFPAQAGIEKRSTRTLDEVIRTMSLSIPDALLLGQYLESSKKPAPADSASLDPMKAFLIQCKLAQIISNVDSYSFYDIGTRNELCRRVQGKVLPIVLGKSGTELRLPGETKKLLAYLGKVSETGQKWGKYLEVSGREMKNFLRENYPWLIAVGAGLSLAAHEALGWYAEDRPALAAMRLMREAGERLKQNKEIEKKGEQESSQATLEANNAFLAKTAKRLGIFQSHLVALLENDTFMWRAVSSPLSDFEAASLPARALRESRTRVEAVRSSGLMRSALRLMRGAAEAAGRLYEEPITMDQVVKAVVEGRVDVNEGVILDENGNVTHHPTPRATNFFHELRRKSAWFRRR